MLRFCQSFFWLQSIVPDIGHMSLGIAKFATLMKRGFYLIMNRLLQFCQRH